MQAQTYFRHGPDFKPLRERPLAEGQLEFKPTSRSTRWIGARFSDVESVVHAHGPRPTIEWVIISTERDKSHFRRGDSGAVILDQDFHPTAMLWGILSPDNSDFAAIAYVTPIVEVLRDIETRLGWEVGSATLN